MPEKEEREGVSGFWMLNYVTRDKSKKVGSKEKVIRLAMEVGLNKIEIIGKKEKVASGWVRSCPRRIVWSAANGR